MAVGRKTGGRSKGTPNQATAAKAAAVAASGLTPLDFMLSIMRDEKNDLDDRLDAAKAAAPFVHPKLGSIELKGDPDNPLRTVTEIRRVIVSPKHDRDGSVIPVQSRSGESTDDEA